MPQLTVFTPTYNRAHTLARCYESLKKQTKKDFVWLIVDDGSTDATEELYKEWTKEDRGFDINYLYQDNSGMHSAHNLAYENISTELNVCIDSDDYMPLDAVEKILKFWNEQKDKEDVAGFMALDAFKNGTIIGNKFPACIKKATHYDYYYKYGLKGDKKFILRTDLSKLYPYPVFEGEKYVNLASKYSLLDLSYRFLNLNEIVCVVEYLADGSSKNMFRQYVENPKGFAYSRKLCMSLPFASLSFKYRQALHYISSCLIIKDKNWLKNSPKKLICLLALVPGSIWFVYIKYRFWKDYK